jgi:hypothetical protein
MRRSVPLWTAALAAAPLAISHTDSSLTELLVAGGGGSYAYVTRGCEGVISKQRIDYDNVGAEVSHKFVAPVRLGVRAGLVRAHGHYYNELLSDTRYVNPYLSLEYPWFSIGGGWVRANRPFPDQDLLQTANGHVASQTASGHIRIGRGTYFEVSYFEAVPLATASYAQMGLGHRWSRVGYMPHDQVGFVGRGQYRIGNRLGLGGTLRLGSSEGISENAFALSLSYRFTHRREPIVVEVPDPWRPASPAAAPVDSAIAPAASDSARSPRRGRSRAPRDRRSRRAPC